MIYKNILVVKLSAIGDVIHALPVAYALKHAYPEARITWVVEKPSYDLLTNNPYIDEIIIFDKPKFKTLSGLLLNGYQLSKQLKSRRFDLVIDLQGLFKSAAIAYLSGAEKRLVYCNARELSHLVSQRICGEHENDHVVDRYLDVPRHLGIKIDQVQFSIAISEIEAQRAETIANHAGFKMDQPYVVLAPGTNWPSKCWPTTHFSQLVDKLYDKNIIPVLIGGPNDTRLANQIIANSKIPPIDLTGKTSLKQLAYIIKKAKIFIGGDTGPMHLAAAVETKVIAIIGPTDPKRNGPYGEENVVLQSGGKCLSCWKRACKYGNQATCMSDVSAKQVYDAIRKEGLLTDGINS